jgi:hypothetical protein
MTTLILAQGYNKPGINPRTGKPWTDATGAFLPEARAFKALHGGTLLELASPTPPPYRRVWSERAIRATTDLDVLAVFGHGTPSRLVLTGHGMAQVDDLVDAIVEAEPWDDHEPLTIVLYACLTGRGRTGFADVLADRLPADHVWAHSTAGHTTWNPYVELAGGPNGGDPVFVPKDGPRWRRWRDRLREDQAYRLSFWKVAHGLPRAQALEAVREEATR